MGILNTNKHPNKIKSCIPFAGNSRSISEKSRMVVLEFGEDFFHDGFAVEDGPGVDIEAAAILIYGGHFTVIEVDDLPVTAHEGGLLLFEIFGIDS